MGRKTVRSLAADWDIDFRMPVADSVGSAYGDLVAVADPGRSSSEDTESDRIEAGAIAVVVGRSCLGWRVEIVWGQWLREWCQTAREAKVYVLC